MNHLLNSKVIIRLNYLIQVILLSIAFYLFSSKLPLIPWHSKLTTYVLLHLLILVMLQFLLFIWYWGLSDRQIHYLKLRRVAFIHLFILLLMSLLSILSIQYFIVGCIIFSITNLYLMYMTFQYLKLHLK